MDTHNTRDTPIRICYTVFATLADPALGFVFALRIVNNNKKNDFILQIWPHSSPQNNQSCQKRRRTVFSLQSKSSSSSSICIIIMQGKVLRSDSLAEKVTFYIHSIIEWMRRKQKKKEGKMENIIVNVTLRPGLQNLLNSRNVYL